MPAISAISTTIGPHQALIYLMVAMSAVDRTMSDSELRRIGRIVKYLPVFRGFAPERLLEVAKECADILGEERGGLEAVLGLVNAALPAHLHDTAYALVCEIAAADNYLEAEEMRLLQLIRTALGIDKLVGAAIERCVRARYVTL
jgi:tellurite resistance protein